MKKLMSLVLTLCMALSLCACGGGQSAPSNSGGSDSGNSGGSSDGVVTVKYAVTFPGKGTQADGAEKMKQLIEEYSEGRIQSLGRACARAPLR